MVAVGRHWDHIGSGWQEPLTQALVLFKGADGLAVVAVGDLVLLFGLSAETKAAADGHDEGDEDQGGRDGADQHGPLVWGQVGPAVHAARVVEGQGDGLLHDSTRVLSHALVLAQVVVHGVGDGQVEPLLVAVGLLEEVHALLTEGTHGGSVVVHDATIDHPSSLGCRTP